jgi:glycosyltransferase involved in cell wall biosynthesis
MRHLVFYHPEDLEESPAKVASKVWQHLHDARDRLDMELHLVTKNRTISKRYKDAVIAPSAMKDLGKDMVFYFPISPAISLRSSTALLLKLKRMKGIMISDYHGDFREDMHNHFKNRDIGLFFYSIPSATLAPLVLNWHEHIILHSQYLKKIILKKYNIKARISVVPNGIDKEVLGRAYDPVELDGDLRIFFHGRHSHEKGLDILLDAVRGLPKGKRKKVRLYVAGRGPLTGSLKKRAKELDLGSQVDFIGYPPLEEVFSYIRSVDLIIYPSRYDNFPVAVLEALAVADCPVMFSDRMGLADYVGPDLKGHVFPLSKKAIKDMITRSMDDAIDVRKAVKAQRRFARRFTWDKVIKDYIDLFNDL